MLISGSPFPRGAPVITTRAWILAVLLLVSALAAAGFRSAAAQPAAAPPAPAGAPRQVVLGLAEIPPFAMKTADGQWEGISVQLWRHVAHDIGVATVYREIESAEFIEDLRQGTIDVFIGAAVTAEREEVIDFSHPYFSTGLAIAVRKKTSGHWEAVSDEIFSAAFLGIVAPLVALLLAVGVIVWLVERKNNPEHFDPHPVRGILDGLWWAAVTTTTVGYGDKAPKTSIGRVLAIVWMFAAVVLVALFTAHVTALLTAHTIRGSIQSASDLPGKRVGVIAGAAYVTELEFRGVIGRGFDTLDAALSSLADGQIDAVVAPEPVLRYLVTRQFADKETVSAGTFLRSDYGFALPDGSNLREPINRALLAFLTSNDWRDLLHRYLGHDD